MCGDSTLVRLYRYRWLPPFLLVWGIPTSLQAMGIPWSDIGTPILRVTLRPPCCPSARVFTLAAGQSWALVFRPFWTALV